MTQWKFWKSELHEQHLAAMIPPSTRRHSAIIDGSRVMYTGASDVDAAEPYPGALKIFPDYRVLGIGERESILTGRRA